MIEQPFGKWIPDENTSNANYISLGCMMEFTYTCRTAHAEDFFK